jgi:signal transduction histidine kinase
MKPGWYMSWLLLLATASYAQMALPIGPGFEEARVEEPFLYQLIDPPPYLGSPTDLPVELTHWQSAATINYGRGSTTGWARFSLRSQSKQPRQVWLELTTHFMDSTGVWMAGPHMPPLRIRGPSSYRDQATPLAPVNHHYFLYALNLPANQTTTIWVRGRVIPGDALKFDVRLWTPTRFLVMQQRDIWGWAMFTGMILAILCGVLIAFAFYQRSIYLLYAGYVFCLSVYALLNDGWGAFLPNSLAWFDSITTIVHWLILGFGAFVMFSRRFLAVSASAGQRLFFRWPEGIPMLLMIGLVFLVEWAHRHKYEQLAIALYLAGFLGFGGYGIIWFTYLSDAFRRKLKLVWLLIGAVSAVLIFFAVTAALINFGLIVNPLPDMVVLRIVLLIEFATLSVGWLYRRKLLQNARQQLEHQNHQLQSDVIQTQEAERQRIAADLHDDLGGTLATLRRRLDDIRQRNSDPDTERAFADAEPLIQKSGDDLRRISHNLMPPEFVRIGLRHALEQLVDQQPLHPTQFTFLVSGVEQRLPVDIELNVYRIVSELIQNINKHAQAGRAAVQMLYHTDQLTITVEDDGIGSGPVKNLDGQTGIGLKNSRLRAEYIGATLWRDPSQAGTLVVLDIPYPTPLYAARTSLPNSLN